MKLLNSEKVVPIAVLAAIAVLFFWNTDSLNPFRLDPDDTVYDYMSADVEEAVRFSMSMCNDGVCISSLDWDCGLMIVDQPAFDECFDDAVKAAPVWARLGVLRRYCGRRTMEFTGRFGEADECAQNGGSWGVPTPPRPTQPW